MSISIVFVFIKFVKILSFCYFLEVMQPSGSSQELWGECFLSKGGKTLQLSQQEREALSWLPKPLLLEGPRLHQPVGGQKPFGHVGHTFTSPKGKFLPTI